MQREEEKGNEGEVGGEVEARRGGEVEVGEGGGGGVVDESADVKAGIAVLSSASATVSEKEKEKEEEKEEEEKKKKKEEEEEEKEEQSRKEEGDEENGSIVGTSEHKLETEMGNEEKKKIEGVEGVEGVEGIESIEGAVTESSKEEEDKSVDPSTGTGTVAVGGAHAPIATIADNTPAKDS